MSFDKEERGLCKCKRVNLKSMANLSNFCFTLKFKGWGVRNIAIAFCFFSDCCLLQAPRRDGKGTSNEVRKIPENMSFKGMVEKSLSFPRCQRCF